VRSRLAAPMAGHSRIGVRAPTTERVSMASLSIGLRRCRRTLPDADHRCRPFVAARPAAMAHHLPRDGLLAPPERRIHRAYLVVDEQVARDGRSAATRAPCRA